MQPEGNRLDASPRERPAFGHPHTCLECGGSFVPRGVNVEFCSRPCRKAWNNRRLVRGAELYDLFMALRWDRAVASGLHVFTALSRMAAAFRAEDVRARAGRRSWASPRQIIERRPYLRAQRLAQQPKRSS